MPKLILDLKTGSEYKLSDTLQLIAYSKMNSRKVEFNSDLHRYQYKGKNLLSVTQVLGLVSSYVETEASKLAKKRGKWIHEACQMLIQGNLNENKMDGEDLPYIRAWKSFLNDYNLIGKDVAIEIPMVNTYHKYAGKIDYIFSYHKDELINVYIDKKGKYKVKKREYKESLFKDFLCLKRAYELKYGG